MIFDQICPSWRPASASPAAMLVPLWPASEPPGAAGASASTASAARRQVQRETVAAVGDLLRVALERARLQREADLQHDLASLVADFSRAVSSSLHLQRQPRRSSAIARAGLFSADRVSVWLHDRRARVTRARGLVRRGGSPPPQRIRRTIRPSPSPTAMRQARAQSGAAIGPADPRACCVPLRGRRRALGTLVRRRRPRRDRATSSTCSIGSRRSARQLSTAIENVWLLEDVLRSRRELESTFNSLADLVVVSDGQLRVTHANQRVCGARRASARSRSVGTPLARVLRRRTGRRGSNGCRRRGEPLHESTRSSQDPRAGRHVPLHASARWSAATTSGSARSSWRATSRDQAQTRGRARPSCAIG